MLGGLAGATRHQTSTACPPLRTPHPDHQSEGDYVLRMWMLRRATRHLPDFQSQSADAPRGRPETAQEIQSQSDDFCDSE